MYSCAARDQILGRWARGGRCPSTGPYTVFQGAFCVERLSSKTNRLCIVDGPGVTGFRGTHGSLLAQVPYEILVLQRNSSRSTVVWGDGSKVYVVNGIKKGDITNWS